MRLFLLLFADNQNTSSIPEASQTDRELLGLQWKWQAGLGAYYWFVRRIFSEKLSVEVLLALSLMV